MQHTTVFEGFRAGALLSVALLAGCEQGAPQQSTPVTSSATPTAAPAASRPDGRWSYHDWPTGHYRVVENWPKPLPDTRHSHDGWTWGSFGGVYAESPDRIWLAHARRAAAAGRHGALDAVRER